MKRVFAQIRLGVSQRNILGWLYDYKCRQPLHCYFTRQYQFATGSFDVAGSDVFHIQQAVNNWRAWGVGGGGAAVTLLFVDHIVLPSPITEAKNGGLGDVASMRHRSFSECGPLTALSPRPFRERGSEHTLISKGCEQKKRRPKARAVTVSCSA